LWLLAVVLLCIALVAIGRRLPSRSPRLGPEGDAPSGPDPEYAVEIGDELDLHGVSPSEVDELVDAFVDLAKERGRPSVKIVHGKGTGRLRQRVRSRLARHPAVVACEDAASPGSGWGATIVHLAPPTDVAPDAPGV
jgi:DNA mismatch repair protein MutS2